MQLIALHDMGVAILHQQLLLAGIQVLRQAARQVLLRQRCPQIVQAGDTACSQGAQRCGWCAGEQGRKVFQAGGDHGAQCQRFELKGQCTHARKQFGLCDTIAQDKRCLQCGVEAITARVGRQLQQLLRSYFSQLGLYQGLVGALVAAQPVGAKGPPGRA